MVLRRNKVLRAIFASLISISTKVRCKLNRNLLSLIKRNKTFLDKKDKNSKEYQDVNFLKNNLDGLRNRYSQLEDYLNSLVIQNARVLDDNKFLCVEILKSRKEAEIKSEKLMLFIMTFMHRVKSLYNNQQLANNGNSTTDVMPININSEFIKKELDNYFKKLQTEELNDEALKTMFERYVAQNTEQVEQFPANLMPINKNSGPNSEDYSNDNSYNDGMDGVKSENGECSPKEDSFDKDIMKKHKRVRKA